MNNSENFPIYRDNIFRTRTNYVILVPSLYFKEKFYIDNCVINSGSLFVYNIWTKYFMDSLKHKTLPFHYYIGKAGNDFTPLLGQPDCNKSYFIQDLVSASIIDYQYLYSLVIMIDFNFNYTIMEKRMGEILACRIINPILHNYNLQPTQVKFIDECYKDNWRENLKESTLEYELDESKFFDWALINPFIYKHKIY